jgi:transposase-like protein
VAFDSCSSRGVRSLTSPVIWASTTRRCGSGCARRRPADSGTRSDILSTEEREEIRKLRREVHDLRRANEILKSASVFFAKELDPDRTR